MKSFPQFVIDSLKTIDPDWALDGVRELGKSYERTREHIKAGNVGRI